MRKRKVFAIILSAILALSLTACSGAVATTQADTQPATVETSTPELVEEPEVTPEPTEEPEVEEVAEAPTEEVEAEPVEDATEAETEESTEEVEEPEEIDPMEALMASPMGEYISDGMFDAARFAKDTKASFWWLGDYSLLIGYENQFIQVGNGDVHPEFGYIAIGNWDETNSERGNLCTYSFLFPSGEDITIAGDVKKIMVPVNCIIYLKDIASFIDENGVDATPDVIGTDFKPCDPMDETVQY